MMQVSFNLALKSLTSKQIWCRSALTWPWRASVLVARHKLSCQAATHCRFPCSWSFVLVRSLCMSSAYSFRQSVSLHSEVTDCRLNAIHSITWHRNAVRTGVECVQVMSNKVNDYTLIIPHICKKNIRAASTGFKLMVINNRHTGILLLIFNR